MVGEVFRFVGKRNRAIVQLYNEIVLKKKYNNFIERLEKGREGERERDPPRVFPSSIEMLLYSPKVYNTQ
jgi:hypothetical protein